MKKIFFINTTDCIRWDQSQPIPTIILCIILIIILKTSDLSGQEYAIGADLSFLKNAEDRGFAFKENDVVKPGLQIFKAHGYNCIRLRLFHTPTELPNNLEYTIALAKKAKGLLLQKHLRDRRNFLTTSTG